MKHEVANFLCQTSSQLYSISFWSMIIFFCQNAQDNLSWSNHSCRTWHGDALQESIRMKAYAWTHWEILHGSLVWAHKRAIYPSVINAYAILQWNSFLASVMKWLWFTFGTWYMTFATFKSIAMIDSYQKRCSVILESIKKKSKLCVCVVCEYAKWKSIRRYMIYDLCVWLRIPIFIAFVCHVCIVCDERCNLHLLEAEKVLQCMTVRVTQERWPRQTILINTKKQEKKKKPKILLDYVIAAMQWNRNIQLK